MPTQEPISDATLIQGLRVGGKEEAKALQHLYWNFYPLVLPFLQRLGSTEEEARDIFQDAVITFYEQVQLNKYRGDSSIKTFLFAVCKNRWYNQLRKKKTARGYVEQEDGSEAEQDTPEAIFLEHEKHELLVQLLNKLGEACRKLLRLKIYEERSMEEISAEMGFKNEQIARNKHYKCKKELRRLALEDPVIKRIIPYIR